MFQGNNSGCITEDDEKREKLENEIVKGCSNVSCERLELSIGNFEKDALEPRDTLVYRF